MAVFGATTFLALITSSLLAHMPVLLTIVVGAMLFVAFFLQASGRAGLVATLLLVSFGLVPVVAVQSPDTASAITFFIFRSGVVAVLWVWLLFALFPSVSPAGAQRASVARGTPAAGDHPPGGDRRGHPAADHRAGHDILDSGGLADRAHGDGCATAALPCHRPPGGARPAARQPARWCCGADRL